METYLVIFILIPFFGYVVNLFVKRSNEKLMSSVAYITMALQFTSALTFTILWIFNSSNLLYTKGITIYKHGETELFLDFCFDKITATYLMVGSLLSLLIIAYSRTYLHREGGYKRFFNTVMFFYFGYNILVLSANLATFFIGWEVAGISSFLLIGYYRNRYIPVRNAVKIFSIYRIADLAFILGIWASHHIWHKNIVLIDLQNTELVISHLNEHPELSIFFCIMILIAASIKSAQFPFSSWLPRAMEGPTPSSAIFYSSLSVHAGLLLLIRTSDFWQQIPGIKVAIIILGLITFLIASATARVQSNIKAQIAYAAIAQIGLMFIEVAFGLDWIVLVHFAGNAFLRSYQLLISPSIVTYQIRHQFYNFKPIKDLGKITLLSRIKKSLYVLCMEEWYMDEFMHHTIWNTLKNIGKTLHFIGDKTLLIIVSILLLICGFVVFDRAEILFNTKHLISEAFSLVGLILALRSFTEKKNVYLAFLLVFFNHLFIIMSVMIAANVELEHILMYTVGISAALLIGLFCLRSLEKRGVGLNLNWYQGHCYEFPRINFLFLLSCLGLIGFPITSAFLGIELFFSYIHEDEILFLALVSIGLLVNSLSLIRIYSRIFLGPHVKTYHEVARKSS